MSSMTTTARPIVRTLGGGAVLCVAAGLALGGCQNDGPPTDFGSVKGDLTPNMQSMAERPIDIDKNLALMAETNGRNFWNDLGRAFYTDHPSRLSPFPMTTLSGQPK